MTVTKQGLRSHQGVPCSRGETGQNELCALPIRRWAARVHAQQKQKKTAGILYGGQHTDECIHTTTNTHYTQL